MNIPFPKNPNSQRKELPFCYICGRQFTKASLPIHEPQCMKKWEVANEQLPPELRKRKPVKPQPMAERGIGGKGGGYDLGASDAAWQAAQSNLVPCPSCGRTFNMDRIEKHVSICAKSGVVPPKKQPTPTAKPTTLTVPAGKTASEPKSKSPSPQTKSRSPKPAASNGPAAGGAKFCTNCGHQFESAAKFCTECGAQR